MALPVAVFEGIRTVQAEGIDREAAAQALTALVGDEPVKESVLWTGPAWGDDSLLLDVYLLSSNKLYNYWQRIDGTSAASCTFLDTLDDISFITLQSELSPHFVALVASGVDRGHIFGKAEDREILMNFMKAIIRERDKQG